MPVCFCYIEKENREVMAMYRGTTPTLEFRLPFETSALAKVYITMAQEGREALTKEVSQFSEADSVAVQLSQAETLALLDTRDLEIQLRCKFTDGTTAASEIIRTTVGRILKDGEI